VTACSFVIDVGTTIARTLEVGVEAGAKVSDSLEHPNNNSKIVKVFAILISTLITK